MYIQDKSILMSDDDDKPCFVHADPDFFKHVILPRHIILTRVLPICALIAGCQVMAKAHLKG